MNEQKWVQFSYERYKNGDEAFLRTGEKFEGEIHYSEIREKIGEECLFAIYKETGLTTMFYKNGKYFRSEDSKYDLVMKPKTKKVWLAIDKKEQKISNNRIICVTSHSYESEYELKEVLLSSYDKTIDWQIVELEIEVEK